MAPPYVAVLARGGGVLETCHVPLVSLSSGDLPATGEPASGTVVLLLHGWGSDERDLAGLARYLPRGMAWASLRAPLRHPQFGYAWYPLDGDDWAPASAIEDATAKLWEWVDQHLSANALVAPVGFSQGGCMAAQMLRTRPDRVAATAILSGYVSPVPARADGELAAAKPRVFWGRGDADPVIPLAAVAASEEWLARHVAVEAHVYPGLGHSVSEHELADLTRFLSSTL